MKILTIGMILVSCCSCAHQDRVAEFAEALPDMVGRSTGDLNENHAELLSKFRDKDQSRFLQPVPWHVWHYMNDAGEDRYVLFSVKPAGGIPGASGAEVRLFSATGEELGAWNFSTGWRIGIMSADFSHHSILDAPLIAIATAPVILGRDVAKQYYSIEDDALFFVRMEDSKGELLRNIYRFSNHTLGGDVSDQSKEQWISNLTSDSAVRRLASLIYIAGEHMDPDDPRHDGNRESVVELEKALEVRTDEAVKKAIKIYRESSLNWLKEAAELADVPHA